MEPQKKRLCYNCFQERPEGEGPCPFCGFDLEENARDYPNALRAGTVLNDRYIVGRVLGQGGFGITYLAWDGKLQARVAVKEFMPNEIATRIGTTVSVAMKSKSEEFTYGAERFQEEARTLAKFMGQPNIAGVTDYFDENDTSYFVMDYIEGISFKTYIANHGGKVSVEEALNVMIPVLRALTAVHGEGFIHRDVTPDNIYITKDGVVKLLDFGSARYSIGDKSKSLDVILKVGYAPKEQYIRRSRQGPYTDVYSCAACFYAAITGYLPPESLERLDHDELQPVSALGIDIPEYLDKAILKGLAVQPEDRFQSAAEFLEAIENQQVVEVPSAAQAADTAVARARRKPLVLGGIAAAVIAVAVGVGVLLGGGGGGTAGGGGSDDGPPLKKAPVPSITIAGETYSTDERRLELENRGLTDEDIQDLRYMINLTYLNLEGNDITDVSPLSGLTELTNLRLSNNRITDVSPLAGLTNLEYISLQENPGLSDLSPLAGLVNVEEISLYSLPITDVSFLSEWTKLKHLQFGDIGNADLSVLSGLTNLNSLYINGSNNTISGLSFLAGMTKLQTLSIQGYLDITDLSPLSELKQLRELSITTAGSGAIEIRTSNLDALSGLTNLEDIRLDVSGLEDLSGLSGLSGLTSLYLYGSQNDPDLSALSNLTGLQELDISASSRETGIYEKDLSFLSQMRELRDVRVVIHGLESFSGMENLTALTDLQLQGDFYITDLSPMSGLKQLRNVYLGQGGNSFGLSDLKALSGLSNMESFTIDADLHSLEGVEGMTSLKELNFYGTIFTSDLSPLSALTKLQILYLPNPAYGEIAEPYDISALASLTELRQLRLSADVKSLVPLAELKKLESLELYHSNNFEQGEGISLEPLGSLSGLNTLALYPDDLIDDLSFISGLSNLRTLDIRLPKDASVSLEPLRNLSQLTALTVQNSESAVDWSAVEHVTAVTRN